MNLLHKKSTIYFVQHFLRIQLNTYIFLSMLETLRAVETLNDRLVVKAPQLVNSCTTNLCENFTCIRCKKDGDKFYNRGSFYYRSMAAEVPEEDPSTLYFVYSMAPNWLSYFWESLKCLDTVLVIRCIRLDWFGFAHKYLSNTFLPLLSTC